MPAHLVKTVLGFVLHWGFKICLHLKACSEALLLTGGIQVAVESRYMWGDILLRSLADMIVLHPSEDIFSAWLPGHHILGFPLFLCLITNSLLCGSFFKPQMIEYPSTLGPNLFLHFMSFRLACPTTCLNLYLTIVSISGLI